MKIIKREDADVFKKETGTSGVIAREYRTGNPDLNIAEVIIRGRYPLVGWSVNHASTMTVYVLRGTGRIVIRGERLVRFKTGDVIEIKKGEVYCWEPNGIVTLLLASHPAWTPDQHQTIE